MLSAPGGKHNYCKNPNGVAAGLVHRGDRRRRADFYGCA